MKSISIGFRVLIFAFAPFPKIQEGFQVVISFLIMVGIITNPSGLLVYLPADMFQRLLLVLAIIVLAVFSAACRLQSRLNRKPFTIEFTDANQFQSTIKIQTYKKSEGQQFNNLKLHMFLHFRFNNTGDKPGCFKGMRIFFMKRRWLADNVIIGDSFGLGILKCSATQKQFLLRDHTFTVEHISDIFNISQSFEIDSEYGFLLLNNRRYFFRVVIQALDQPDLIVNIIPNWDEILNSVDPFVSHIKMIKQVN